MWKVSILGGQAEFSAQEVGIFRDKKAIFNLPQAEVAPSHGPRNVFQQTQLFLANSPVSLTCLNFPISFSKTNNKALG